MNFHFDLALPAVLYPLPIDGTWKLCFDFRARAP